MGGARAVPVRDADALIADVPALGSVPRLAAENVLNLPSAHMTPDQALELATRAVAAAADGEGVVITTGTDTLEEIAVLCAVMHRAGGPIAVTGANRPASAPGADGAANLIDAVAVAGAAAAGELGTVVVFGGEVHAAMTVRKVDSTGPAAFGSPMSGPLGRVVEGRLWLVAHPNRGPALEVRGLGARVEIISPALGSDAALLAHAAEHSDGLVVVALGAGHLSPPLMSALATAAARVPVVVTCRPDRSSMLFSTYGFDGSEGDLREHAICAPFLSPQAARITLMSCLGAGLDRDRTAAVFAPWDAGT